MEMMPAAAGGDRGAPRANNNAAPQYVARSFSIFVVAWCEAVGLVSGLTIGGARASHGPTQSAFGCVWFVGSRTGHRARRVKTPSLGKPNQNKRDARRGAQPAALTSPSSSAADDRYGSRQRLITPALLLLLAAPVSRTWGGTE